MNSQFVCTAGRVHKPSTGLGAAGDCSPGFVYSVDTNKCEPIGGVGSGMSTKKKWLIGGAVAAGLIGLGVGVVVLSKK